MPCPDCNRTLAHAEDCIAIRLARGELSPREAQILRLESAVPCPECGRGSPLGTHDCEAVPACRRDDGNAFARFADHIYVDGYDRCIECGAPAPDFRSAPEPELPGLTRIGGKKIGKTTAAKAIGGAKPSEIVLDEFGKLAERMKGLGVSARATTQATANVGEAYGIPVRADPSIPDGRLYVVGGGRVGGQYAIDHVGPADVIEGLLGDPHAREPEAFLVSPGTWARFRDGVVSQDGKPVGGVLNFDIT